MRKRLLLIFIILIVVSGVFAAITGFFAQKGIKNLKLASAAAKNQDLDGAKKALLAAKGDFQAARTSFLIFTPVRFIPVIGWYVSDVKNGLDVAVSALDAGRKFADAVTPYADILGLKGDGTFLGGTAQERLANAVGALSKITPQIDDIGKSLTETRNSIDKIKSWRYPNFLPGKPKDKIEAAQKAINEIESLIVNAKPFLSVLPDMMGQEKERKYLILFQNDKELRPTGGFITAYAIFRVNRGVITSEGSDDIYRLDDQLLKKVPAPQPIIKYLPNVPTLNLRDSNLSPDFKSSMRTFESLYQSTNAKKDIDGIFALDTDFVLKLMEVLGPIEAYGTKFTTEKVDVCDCPQIIYELERYADQPVAYEKGSRKDIIGVLMQQMMSQAFNAPKSSWPKLLEAGISSLRDKHLLLYFYDQANQEAVEKINFAGRLYQWDGDYLHINETNFAGAKSNLYIQQKVKQKITRDKDGNLNKLLTVEYKYPRRGDNCSLERQGGLCLAGIYRDWIRIYVPEGSKLVKSSGTDQTMATTTDLGKTVFEGFFELRPEGALKIEVEYTVPVKADQQYKLLIQKQPGTDNIFYEIDALGKKVKAFPLTTDKQLIVKL